MSKTIPYTNGIVNICESLVVCPHCERNITLDEFEGKFNKQDKHYLIIKCKCKRKVGITGNNIGDFIAFNPNEKVTN